MQLYLRLFLLWIFLGIIPVKIIAKEEPPKIGNFAVPEEQQPGSLIAFGENIVNKDTKKFLIFADDFGGVNQHFIDFYPSFIYGITDNLSILVTTPIAIDYQSNSSRSRGLEDSVIQLEYAFYNKSTRCYVDQASVVTNVTLPTGSVQKDPYTGFGAPSYFLGAQFERIYADWYGFTSDGALFPSSKNGTRIGNIYYYQFGIGRNIMNVCGWVLAGVTELDGYFYERNRISGEIDPDSGGNVIYFMPSFWASNKDFIWQFGTGWAVQQHLFGDQSRNTFLAAASFRWNI